MISNISEEEQRQFFIDTWNDKEVQLFCEVPVFCRSIDLVKYDKKRNTVTAIEFKLSNWKRAIDQVISTAISFDYLEICICKPKMQKTQDNIIETCKTLGIGLYFFDLDKRKFEYVVEAQKVEKIWNVQKSQVIEYIEKGENTNNDKQ